MLTANIQTMKLLARATFKQQPGNFTSDSQAVKRLTTNRKNGPYHVFGMRKRCQIKTNMIKKNGKVESAAKKSKGHLLTRLKLMVEIQKATNIEIDKAGTQILALASNAVELYMRTVLKIVGEKHVHCLKGSSYKNRCHMAAIAYKSKGPKWHYDYTIKRLLCSPGTRMTKLLHKPEKQKKMQKTSAVRCQEK